MMVLQEKRKKKFFLHLNWPIVFFFFSEAPHVNNEHSLKAYPLLHNSVCTTRERKCLISRFFQIKLREKRWRPWKGLYTAFSTVPVPSLNDLWTWEKIFISIMTESGKGDVKDARTFTECKSDNYLFVKWPSLKCVKVTKSRKSHLADPIPKFVQGSMPGYGTLVQKWKPRLSVGDNFSPFPVHFTPIFMAKHGKFGF